MINNRLFTGILAFVLVAGMGIPAFAADEFGNLESGEQSSSQAPSVPEERIFLPEATNVVTNGDFETGSLNGWTTFLTAGGLIHEGICLFDTNGVSGQTQSACFNVGRAIITQGPSEGGGILQSVITPAGTVQIAADIATHAQIGPNVDCGTFKLFFDNVEVDSFAFGGCDPLPVQRSQLSAQINSVSAGSHEVKIQMTRTFGTIGNNLSPMQYVDNVQVLVDIDNEIVGGEFLPIETTSLLLAGAQTFSWMIPVVLSAIGIGLFVVSRKSE